jgi:orotidine-5'-phosphate decarboxylase
MNLEITPGIIIALDIPISEAGALVQKLKPVEDKIAGYKVSSLNAMENGLKATVAELRQFTEKPIIYDHQKGGTDIPNIVEKQVKLASECGINSFIAVPLGAGSETLTAFVNACKETHLLPIVLLSMTHDGADDYLKEETADLIFEKAKELGVKYFVAPGNKPQKILELKAKMDADMCVQAGTDYPIVGRGVYEAEDPVKAVEELFEQAKKGFEKR